MATSKKSVPPLEPHPLVAALQPDPSKPPIRTVKVVGLLGTSSDPHFTRLWLDTDLANYLDVPTSEIHHSVALPNDGGTILWLSPDTPLTYGSTTDAASVGQFLTGSITRSYLGGAAAASSAGKGAGPEGLSLGAPCISLGVACGLSMQCATVQDVCRVSFAN
jgi:hypothetical protein